jgi:uncharacterized protein (TIGR02145 family)
MKTKELSNKRKGLTLFLLTCLVVNVSLHAQVTVGGLTDPAAGALLDLNSATGAKGGLVLSNVAIEDLWKIPTNAEDHFPGITDGSNDDVNPSFTGALVYHTGQNNIPTGIYVWNGDNWTPATDDCREIKLTTPTIALDAQVRAVLENRPITFSLDVQTPSCSLNRYEWYRTAANANGTGNFETTPFAVTVGSTTLSIDNFPDGRAIYKVKVKVTGPYLPSGTSSAESNELEIVVGGCAAKIGAAEWRFFMCHNLGATQSADPFTPSYQINGAYYQWGADTPAASAPGSANPGDDGSIGSWNSTGPSTHYGNNVDGDDNATVKSGTDPCPAGYRVPSQKEWNGLRNYYTSNGTDDKNDLVTTSGTWQGSTCVTCFSGKNFGGSLFLPAAGNRILSDGRLSDRGYYGYYWSTRRNGNSYGGSLYFGDSTTITTPSDLRGNAFSVRCIAE